MLTTCMLALAVLGSGDSAESGEPHVLIRVKSLEMKGVDWRGPAGPSLQPCARQGTATIWTADGATAAGIVKAASKVIDAPKITTVPGSPASVVDEVNRNYVAEIVRRPGESMPFEPKIQTVHDGWRGLLTCRPLDQGVLAAVSIDTTQFMGFHPVNTTETFRVDGKPEEHQFKAQYQVPEVVSAHVAGDWLIPKGGCLVIAFGVHTANNAEGKPSAVERVLLVQAEPFSTEPTPIAEAGGQLTAVPELKLPPVPSLPRLAAPMDGRIGKISHVQPVDVKSPVALRRDGLLAIAVSLGSPLANLPAAKAKAAMPKLPSRTIPQAFSANGTPVAAPTTLPEIADDIPYLSASGDDSAEPRPSPQSLQGVENFILKSVAGFNRNDVAELISLLRNHRHHDDELCPVDADVKATGETESDAACQEKVRRFSLGGGVVVEVPAKYLTKHEADGK